MLTKGCLWTAQGALECASSEQVSIKQKQVTEHYVDSATSYSINVFMYDSNSTLIKQRILVNLDPKRSQYILMDSPNREEEYNKPVKIKITDMTNYHDTNMKELELLLEQAEERAIPIYFSDKQGLDNIYYRTAEVELKKYKGFTLSFK